MKKINCLVCHEDNAETIIEREFPKHGICRNCGFVYMNPIQPFDQSIEFYENDYWIDRKSNWNKATSLKEVSNVKVTPRIKAIYDWLSKKITAESEILEIGAGYGYNLAYIKSQIACNLEAIEPSREGVDFMGKEFGIKGMCTSLENCKTDKKYDIIIMSHVLEHFENPQKALEICFSLLKEKGWLWIEVPNILNPNPKKDLKNWLAKVHISYFSFNKLEYLLGLEKFKVLRKEEDIYVRLLVEKSDAPLNIKNVNEFNAVKTSLSKQKELYNSNRNKSIFSKIKNKIFR